MGSYTFGRVQSGIGVGRGGAATHLEHTYTRSLKLSTHAVDDPILLTLEIMIAVLMITLVATKAESHNMGFISVHR